MTFKEKLTILRKNKGLTQEEFAKAIGVSRQAVHKWEAGVSYPEVPKLLEIKTVLEISLDNLFDEGYEVSRPEKKKAKKLEKKEENKEAEVLVKEPEKEEKKTEEKTSSKTIAEKEEKEKKVGFLGRLFGKNK